MAVTAVKAPPKVPLKNSRGRAPFAGHWKAFFMALGIGVAIFLPFIIFDKGLFIYYGDFNVQQIPFYKLAHEAVRSGNIFWNWKTDLGANFFGSYSFYLLFSPFFWLTLLFPTAFVPYLMAPLLILKTACAAMTSYLYIKRFVRNANYAVIGSLLYAFSGWMSYNIFFNHFHEAAVFFPLLLLALEKLVTEDNIGFFAIAVAVNAMVNYWFFIGEVVFVILYIIVRTYSKGWRMTWKKFGQIALESVIGVALAAAVLLPSVLALMGNPRTDADRMLKGWGFWIYWHDFSENGSYPQRIPGIIASLFFPPDSPAFPNLFPDHGAKWASLSGWLPMFGMVGTIAYFSQQGRKKDWLRTLLGLSLFIALVPGLNSIFVLLNNSYYARWFYMPILLMVVATARAVEDSKTDMKSMNTGFKWVGIITGIVILAVGVTPNKVDGKWVFGLADNIGLAWLWYAFVVLGLLVLFLLFFRFRYHKKFQRYLAISLSVWIVVFNGVYIINGKIAPDRSARVREVALGGRREIEALGLLDEQFARSDIYDDMDNMLMFWGLPNIQAFHSIVPVSIMEFYPAVGVKRDVGSRPETEHYAVRSLLSTRWLFVQQDKDQEALMPGYAFYNYVMDYNIYENQHFLPMGFTYDYYIPRRDFDRIPKDSGANMLLEAIELDDDGIYRNQDILLPYPEEISTLVLGQERYAQSIMERRRHTATNFTTDNYGFSAETDFPNEKLVFFSVPYETGWSATVNGKPAVIEKANIGFMAVRVPEGQATIRFNYMTPGLLPGLAVTGAVGVLALAVFVVTRKKRHTQKLERTKEQAWLRQSGLPLSLDEYLYRYRKIQRKELQEKLTDHSPAPTEEVLQAQEYVSGLTPEQVAALPDVSTIPAKPVESEEGKDE